MERCDPTDPCGFGGYCPDCQNKPEQASSGNSGLLSAAADYIEILELKLRSVSPYGNVMPWDRPKDADIAAAKGRWLAEKAFTEVKGR